MGRLLGGIEKDFRAGRTSHTRGTAPVNRKARRFNPGDLMILVAAIGIATMSLRNLRLLADLHLLFTLLAVSDDRGRVVTWGDTPSPSPRPVSTRPTPGRAPAPRTALASAGDATCTAPSPGAGTSGWSAPHGYWSAPGGTPGRSGTPAASGTSPRRVAPSPWPARAPRGTPGRGRSPTGGSSPGGSPWGYRTTSRPDRRTAAVSPTPAGTPASSSGRSA